MTSPGHSPTPARPTAAPVAAVLAVKDLVQAKSRLAADHDMGPAHRRLVLAMLCDTLAAIADAGVSRAVVVSPDAEVLQTAERFGAVGVAEVGHPATDGVSGLNHAFADGAAFAARRWPEAGRILLIQADLPAATGGALAEVLDAAPTGRHAFLSDRDGTGTALLIRPASFCAPPHFGPASASAHRGDGAVDLDPSRIRWTGLRTDVDTVDDLRAAAILGLGRHTLTALHDTPGAVELRHAIGIDRDTAVTAGCDAS
ncbi:2-phospho-L-lactate guanylyltransferase [Gordonia sp. ABSL1-1]|uniref:2-phospho-L-lactate guanylyltransferase n=1 Tax=Gordonia sp. ABSL1-1 TaxID=3053923 RepID=UPI002573F3B9|nr:2-phospho-L-lactate guanylyltransferase [Gordonia sp. ABSL1-1]MDL9935569.1 2-phospho-L-lactate guanylyltransferase [Gordonia sp. ABSL1-1]